MDDSGIKPMEPTSLDRWRHVCSALDLTNSDAVREKLLRSWAGWGRHYHTTAHLTACLREFDTARGLSARPAEVELALWFHDAIYRPYRSDNEIRCAAWATAFMRSHGASIDATTRVRDLVLATQHNTGDMTGDCALVTDVDLSILGQSQVAYDEFERNVRREFWWVPKKRYARARTRVLRSFLSRPTLYFWPSFRDRCETAARDNLERAIATLTRE